MKAELAVGVGKTTRAVFLKDSMPWRVGIWQDGVCNKCVSNAGPPLQHVCDGNILQSLYS